MSKQAQLIECIIQDVIKFIVVDYQVEFDDAMKKFYISEVFDKLQDGETGLYIESSSYVYAMFEEELSVGKLIQREI